MTHERIGYHVLRLGLSALFLWFGFSQLTDGINWVSWVPEWAVELLNIPPAMIVLGNGAFEVVLGALLAMNFFVRPVAVLLALHLAVITVEIGITPTGVRDFGLTMATLALAFSAVSRKKTNVSS
ncbi:MAG: DoxX family protein [Minisyncoccia bacterium]